MDRLLPFRSDARPETGDGSRILEIDERSADRVFEALASNTTREIFTAVYEQAGTATEIAERVDTSLQNTKYHLDKLQDADLITVADTWYSAQGNEMKVYAPTNETVVVIAGDERATSSLRNRLRRLVGSVGLLLAGSVIVQRLATGSEPAYQRQPRFAVSDPVADPGVWLSPGLLFFVGGVFTFLLTAVWVRSVERR